MKIRNTRIFLLVLFCIFYCSSIAFAHKISAFLDVEGNKVTVYSYFNDGTPVKRGKVEVYDSTGKLILTGKTNSEGEFVFTVPKPDNYKIVVIAELGHRAVAELKKEDLSGGGEETAEKSEEATVVKEEKKVEKKENEVSNIVAASISEDKLKQIIREELKRELKPIHQELLGIKEELSSVSFKDVFSGLGWILGIFGGAALVYARKNGK